MSRLSVRFVDKYQNKKFLQFILYSKTDVYDFLDDILIHVKRLLNLKVLHIYENSNEDEPLQRPIPRFDDLGRVCKSLKKVVLDLTLDNFDLWHTFRYFDGLRELEIKRNSIHKVGPVLVDSNSRITPLVKLKQFKIRCQSIGFYFFSEIKDFSPNIEVLYLAIIRPQHRLTNHSLIALSKCKLLKDLDIYMPQMFVDDDEDDGVYKYTHLNDIGILHLIENCKDINRIALKLFDNILMSECMAKSLVKWIEWEDKTQKKKITLECCPSYNMCESLPELSRLDDLVKFSLQARTFHQSHMIAIKYNKDSTISADYRVSNYSWRRRDDIWIIFSLFKNLQHLVFCAPNFDFYKSVPNIELLFNLREIQIECLHINNGFFEHIVRLAPNLKDFELKSLFELTNGKLKMLCKLKHLIRVNLMCPEKRDHETDDKGIIQLLNNCTELRELLFDFEVNITFNSINRFIELAKERLKDIITFQCFVNSPELQSNQLTGIQKNLIIQTKFIEEKQ